jgi:hypothetical protein
MKRSSLTILFLCAAFSLFLSPALAGTATVKWNANTETDLAGYKVYYGTVSRSYQPAIPVGKVTSLSIPGLTEGKKYYFAVAAVDTSGNESGYSAEVSKTIGETQPPTVKITSPTTEGSFTTNNSALSFSGTASDNVGVTSVTWTNSRGGGGNASGTNSWSVSTINLLGGENVITITAKDAAGNEGKASLAVIYNLPDAIAPTIKISSPTTSGTYSTNNGLITLSGTASDNVGVTLVTWANASGGSGNAVGTNNWSVSSLTLRAGENMIVVKAKDAAGNESSASLQVTYSPPTVEDTEAPSVKISSPTSNSSYRTRSSTIQLSGTASDNVGVTRVSWTNSNGRSGDAVGIANWSVSSIPLSKWKNVIVISATDAAGNTGTRKITIYRW